jgi:nuclear pore complex protein Nup98-Nup96
VPNFVVVRKGYGSISFKAPVDLTEIQTLSILREYVQIEQKSVTVYPDKSKHASPGTGLNVPAEVKMEAVRPPPDLEVDEFEANLKSTANTNFVSYDANTNVWIYTVDHFSTIAVPDESKLASVRNI